MSNAVPTSDGPKVRYQVDVGQDRKFVWLDKGQGPKDALMEVFVINQFDSDRGFTRTYASLLSLLNAWEKFKASAFVKESPRF